MIQRDYEIGDIVSALRAIALMMWPVATMAAGESLGTTLGSVTLADWLSLLLLSGVSGLVALLHRLRRSLEAQATAGQSPPTDEAAAQRIDWRVFALCHMTGAMFIGAIAFFVCEGLDFNNYVEAAAIALFSWSGAKLADKMADGLSEGVLARLSGAFGPANNGKGQS